MTDRTDAIWRAAETLRARGRMNVCTILQACRATGLPPNVDDLGFILTRFERSVDHFVPSAVTAFIAKLLKPYAPQSVLDPWAGMGSLAIPLNQELSPSRYDAYTRNPEHAEVWRQLEGTTGITLYEADALTALRDTTDSFDAIVSCLPWGIRSSHPAAVALEGETLEVTDELGHLLILESSRRLTNDGLGVFVVTERFFTNSGKPGKVRHTLGRLGFRVVAAIELPAGTFSPLTSLTTHLVIVRRSNNDCLFTGGFAADEDHQNALLRNLMDHKAGRSTSLGRIVPIETFRGFLAIDLKERVEEQARRMGLVPYSFADVVAELISPPSSGIVGFEEKPNAVYLPQMAATAAVTTQSELPERLKSYFQLVLKSEAADAEFVARLWNTAFGQLWRDSLRTGATIPRIGREALRAATIYLPPVKARSLQRRGVQAQQTISRLRSELNELEQQLWRKIAHVEQVESALKSINRNDRLEAWLDTLRFPLASILWVCLTQGGSDHDQKTRKLHFFEALAEFLAVVHLSALSAHVNLWPEIKRKLEGTLVQSNLSFRFATFGLWTRVYESLSAEARRLLQTDEEVCFEIYKTRSRTVLAAITSKQLTSILQTANAIRNKKAGHSGAIGGTDDKEVNGQLRLLIDQVRDLFGTTWDAYELLLPAEARFVSGAFQYSTKRIVGSRTPFALQNTEVAEAMDDGRLYLKSPDERRGLRLLPFVKILASPKTEENACYFFSSVDKKGGHRFLSYHHHAEAEVTQSFDDVASALSGLTIEPGT